ncbi:RHS repeat-associated core domain-containing protein, partial [Paludibaculum fermentans]|uniref:RHS repeat-associated core domain-containing protein n=1 Tax=Paludibaculum fermentans TaxID=1473598 RepID=UPI003EC11712
YIYDAYGRVTMVKRYPVSTGAEDVNQRTTNTYDYDGAGSSTRNIWGRLAAVSVPGAVTEHYSYTAAGLLTSKASDFGGSSYMTPTVDYSYDNEGKVTQMVYPQHGRLNTPTTYDIFPRLTLNYGYDAMGQLQKITSGSGPGVDLVNSATYNAAGQLLSSMRASAVSVGASTDLPTAASLGLETFQYNGRNQLTEQTGLGTDLNYWYSATANDGRLAQKHNWVTGEEENYTYDSLGRLAAAYTTGPQWGLSFVYDGFGNRLQQNVTKGTAPSTVQTVDTATNRLNGAGFGYDSNGNMTGWSTPSGSVTASYDVENRMTQIVTPSVTETYAYGPGNLRVKKYQGGAWTYTVYGQGGEVLGTYSVCTVSSAPFLCQAKLRVYFGGRLVLSGWSGVTADRLGSPQGVHGRVYPYGEVSGSVSVDQDETFTTYKRDVYTGLDYAQNRYYASSWGRFTTADPYRASGGPEDPGSWNRYSYVGNDPTNFGDPSGLQRWMITYHWSMCGWSGGALGGTLTCTMFDTYGSFESGGGGGSGNIDMSIASGKKTTTFTAPNGLKIWNPANSVSVDKAWMQLKEALADDPDCLKWLNSSPKLGENGDVLQYMTEKRGSIGWAALSDPAVAAISNTGTYVPVFDLLVNTSGGFFNGSGRAGYESSYSQITSINFQSQRFKGFLLLHEMSHLLAIPGFISGDGASSDQKANNDKLWSNCSKVISGFSN